MLIKGHGAEERVGADAESLEAVVAFTGRSCSNSRAVKSSDQELREAEPADDESADDESADDESADIAPSPSVSARHEPAGDDTRPESLRVLPRHPPGIAWDSGDKRCASGSFYP